MKSRLHSIKLKQKSKLQIEKTSSFLPPNLQAFNQKVLSGIDFLVYI